MANVSFYGKPGCAGNQRQIRALRAAGHAVMVHDLLSEPWSEATLRPFLQSSTPADWFNRSAIRVKCGEINPDTLDAPIAIALLLSDPALIRRPLLQVGARRIQGWQNEQIDEWIGLADVRASEACALEG